MAWQSALAIYALFWVLSAFLVMPFGVRTHDEAGVDKVRGQADSAPANFAPGRIILRTTIVASAIFALFMANWMQGWVTRDTFAFLTPERFR
jgi:predicted secreted protein